MFYRPSLHTSLLLERTFYVLGLQYILYLKIFKDQEKSCNGDLTCIHLSSEKNKQYCYWQSQLATEWLYMVRAPFFHAKKKNFGKHNTGIQVVNAKYITLHQSTKQYSGCPCRSHYQLLTEN